MKGHAKVICEEFALANLQLQMGRPRREVLHDLGRADRAWTTCKALAAILIQADRFGSSIAQALRVQSDSMRTRRRQIAEEKAAKTAVKLIFPLVLFIFPAIFVVLVGPAAIQIQRNLLDQGRLAGPSRPGRPAASQGGESDERIRRSWRRSPRRSAGWSCDGLRTGAAAGTGRAGDSTDCVDPCWPERYNQVARAETPGPVRRPRP